MNLRKKEADQHSKCVVCLFFNGSFQTDSLKYSYAA